MSNGVDQLLHCAVYYENAVKYYSIDRPGENYVVWTKHGSVHLVKDIG